MIYKIKKHEHVTSCTVSRSAKSKEAR